MATSLPTRANKRKTPSTEIVEPSAKRSSRKSGKVPSCELPENEESLVSSSQIEPDGEMEQLFDRFPQEVQSKILTIIFPHLPLRDRKNARLVSRLWFEASNVEKTLKTEKLCLDVANITDIDASIQILENSKRSVLNLTFSGVNFNNTDWSPRFWTKCGPKIRSLELSSCILSDDTLKLVIQHCDHLENLVLEQIQAGEGQPKIRAGTCLEKLIDSKVSRKNLTSFKMYGWQLISNNFLRAIFTIYPNIKDLVYCVHIFDEFFELGDAMDDASLRLTDKCTFALLVKKLIDSQKTLESFGFGNGWIPDEWSLKFWSTISTLKFPKLKAIHILFEIEGINPHYHEAIEFFARHKQLETIEWLLPIHATPWFVDELMISLLKKCTNLTSLELDRSCEPEAPVVASPSVFTSLRKSKLKSLTVSFGLDTKGIKRTVVNNDLKTLCITDVPMDAFDEMDSVTICRTFRGLTKLDIDIPALMHDDCLQIIIQFQPNLTSLKLYSENLTDYGFTGVPTEDNPRSPKGYSIQKLNKIESLKLIMAGDDNWEITESTLAELKFPNLKYLAVRVPCKWELTKDFLKLISTFSELEVVSLELTKETIDRTACLEVCSKLKWLTDFHIQFKKCENFFDNETYKSVYECCPSLRSFSYKIGSKKRQSFYYDVVTRNIMKAPAENGSDDDDDDSDSGSDSD